MKEWYTVLEAAKALRVSRQAVYDWISAGELTRHDEGLSAFDLDVIRHNRITEAHLVLVERQDVPRIW